MSAYIYCLDMLRNQKDGWASTWEGLYDIEVEYPLNSLSKPLLKICQEFVEPMEDNIPIYEDKKGTSSDGESDDNGDDDGGKMPLALVDGSDEVMDDWFWKVPNTLIFVFFYLYNYRTKKNDVF